jgi:hypothetical protein
MKSWKEPDVRRALGPGLRLQLAGPEMYSLLQEWVEGEAQATPFTLAAWTARVEALLALIDGKERETLSLPRSTGIVKQSS